MDSPLKHELQVALKALQASAALCQRIVASWDSLTAQKDDLTLVTVGDLALQALLAIILKEEFPDDAIVGEEDGSLLRKDAQLGEKVQLFVNEALRKEKHNDGRYQWQSFEQIYDLLDKTGKHELKANGVGKVWVIDPIDGTRNFVRGHMFAINIALLVDGKQVLSALGCPRTSIDATAPLHNQDVDPAGIGCMIFAVKDHGAFAAPLDSDILELQPRKLQNCSSTKDDIRFVTKAGLVKHGDVRVHELIAGRLNAVYPGCDLLPWTLRWAMLAMGLGNATVWVYKSKDYCPKLWDHAGAMLLFEETGGLITDVLGKPIDLTTGAELSANVGFVAGTVASHELILKTTQQVLKEQGYGRLFGA